MSNWRKKDYLNQKVDEYINRKPFEYDLASDPSYQRYKDQYLSMGKMAAEDAMGVASAATGGYGNSYAQTAAQDSYQGYVDKLNAVAPELLNDAYSRYTAQGDKMLKDISVIQTMQDQLGTISGNWDNGTLTASQVKAMQDYLGLKGDGLWGPKSTAAAGGLTADEAWKKYGKFIK